jgi:hypothetical protein
VVRRTEGMVFGLEEQRAMAWKDCKELDGHWECRVKWMYIPDGRAWVQIWRRSSVGRRGKRVNVDEGTWETAMGKFLFHG